MSKLLKRLVFAWFFLLLFEGALRKWIFPSCSGPLLLVRDPLTLAIYALMLQGGKWPRNFWLAGAAVLAVLCTLASFAAGCPPAVTLYGLRTDFFQLPLIFMLPSILSREDVRRIGKWTLAIVPAMALLALLQFRAGPGHWLNATTGGGADEQATQLFATVGRVRPAGTFSFITGMVSFLTLASAFAMQSFLGGARDARLRTALATGGLVLALGVSGSRAAILSVFIVVAVSLLVCLRNPARFRAIFAPVVIVCAAFLILKNLSDFRVGLDVNRDRFDNAGGLRTGIVDRWFGDFILAGQALRDAPLLGSGLGLGTNVGAGLTTGKRQFLLAEGEWARIVLESGPILGALCIALRLGIAASLLRRAWRALMERGDTLPALLFAASISDLTLGQWGQTTVAGFAILSSGLCLAASADGGKPVPKPRAEPLPELRGRSVYAGTIQGGREL